MSHVSKQNGKLANKIDGNIETSKNSYKTLKSFQQLFGHTICTILPKMIKVKA